MSEGAAHYAQSTSTYKAISGALLCQMTCPSTSVIGAQHHFSGVNSRCKARGAPNRTGCRGVRAPLRVGAATSDTGPPMTSGNGLVRCGMGAILSAVRGAGKAAYGAAVQTFQSEVESISPRHSTYQNLVTLGKLVYIYATGSPV